jgi:nucleotide-binding universal stress UspA family protein
MAAWKKLCCAIDFSDASRAAMRQAAALARRLDAELDLLHVHVPQPVAPPDLVTPALDFAEIASAELKGAMAAWQEEAERIAGRAVRSTVLPGAVVDEIVRFTTERGHDLVIVGSHGLTGVKRLLLGSVAERVVREAPCPVLVIRGAASANADPERRV